MTNYLRKKIAGVVKTAFYVSAQTFWANKKIWKIGTFTQSGLQRESKSVFFKKKTCEQSFMKSLFQEEQQIFAENRLENWKKNTINCTFRHFVKARFSMSRKAENEMSNLHWLKAVVRCRRRTCFGRKPSWNREKIKAILIFRHTKSAKRGLDVKNSAGSFVQNEF